MFYNCNVVLLTTDKEATIGDIISYPNGILVANCEPINLKAKQLYVTVPDKIKVGDWCVHEFGDLADTGHRLIQANKSNVDSIQEWWKKVVASTDVSIGFPNLSKAFVNLYTNRYKTKHHIEKATIEYERWITNLGRPFVVRDDYPITQKIFDDGTGIRVVINDDNTVNIKEAKESWDKEEVLAVAFKAFYEGYIEHDRYCPADIKRNFDKWAKNIDL